MLFVECSQPGFYYIFCLAEICGENIRWSIQNIIDGTLEKRLTLFQKYMYQIITALLIS